MTDDRWQMADDKPAVNAGGCGCGEGEGSEPMSEECGDLPSGASMPPPHAPRIAGTSGDCGEGQRERSEPTPQECRAPKKVPNEAQPESTQSHLASGLESSVPGPAGRERSQSWEGVACGERIVASGQ